MDITVTGRKTAVTDRFRRHLEEKLEKIPAVAPRVNRTEVVLTHEANPRLDKISDRVEITCYVKRTVVRAEAAADEEYAALDLAMTKVLERLRRLHDKQISRSGKYRLEPAPPLQLTPEALASEDSGSADGARPDDDATAEAVDKDLGTEGNSPIELREKVHHSPPMTVGQALSQMELVGHDFFLFFDKDTQQPSVVYRRRGWSYGVLRLETGADEAAHPDDPDTADSSAPEWESAS